MGRKVENPFKEQGFPSWIRYLAAGVGGFFIAWLLFGGKGDYPPLNDNVSSSSQALKSGLRSVQPKGQDGNDDDNTDDDYGAEKYKNDDFVDLEPEGEENDEKGSDYQMEFPDLDQDDYLGWVQDYYQKLEFESFPPRNRLTKPILIESLLLGCDYLAANQKEDTGNFNYQYDFVEQKLDTDDSPVRQAGALWGMTLCFQSRPNNEFYRASVERGIAFFQDHMIAGPVKGSSMIEYPGSEESQSGVSALYGLTLIDYMRTIRDNELPEEFVVNNEDTISDLEDQLAKTIEFLRYMKNPDLHFSEAFDFESDEKSGDSSSPLYGKSSDSSPYYDGETLLCLVKAAKYIDGYSDTLVPLIEEVAPVLAKSYTLDAWRGDEYDSENTKGFYQWSSMAFTEYYFAEWKDYEYFGDLVLCLAHWIVHIHGILDRNRNTGYAYEGIISAFRIAQDRSHEDAMGDLEFTIHEGLYKLGTWQVGGPLADRNKFLVENPTDEKIAIGGIMNAEDMAPLRIDTTQHQMHAVMMALETLFKIE